MKSHPRDAGGVEDVEEMMDLPKGNEIRCVSLSPRPGIELLHTGPPLDLGPLPSFFYFALSGTDSLCVDPFNQPVQFLVGRMIRIFSMTLPAHEGNLSPKEALRIWAQDYERGLDPLGDFLDRAKIALDFAVEEGFVDGKKMATGGLSRGGFIAAHLAARDERLRSIVAFAPLTQLQRAAEFTHLHHNETLQNLSLEKIAPQICDRQIRIYIGNSDAKVGTRECFNFVMALVENGEKKKIRSPQIELFLSPSIGYKGHGTAPEIFQAGARWIGERLS